ncbi:MmcQ/YjbR family DNA-binding protein [Paracoccus sediminicola]|uniref:MmcQ/YjbR family DNA-binding protein n=1 Tax=Paracoccus sediminicola TaxID=3017783 RepID=UPI0022F02BD2|nr:MmcQ/YjbR family DNA-binding protein [Paracoccus sediminicola]WBU57945.1 MmcQ/YjbR family DNA-binding protein [Paracoccus sediminicola]
MSRGWVNDFCAEFPGAVHSDPWGGGHDCWKLGERIFALIGTREDRVSVKCDTRETATMLIEAGVAFRAPYMHRSWVALPCNAARDELAHRIIRSYCLIREKLPRTIRDGLAPFDPAALRMEF